MPRDAAHRIDVDAVALERADGGFGFFGAEGLAEGVALGDALGGGVGGCGLRSVRGG